MKSLILFIIIISSTLLFFCCKNKNPADSEKPIGGKIVFTMMDNDATPQPIERIFKMNIDGTGLTRLMFNNDVLDTVNGIPRPRGSGSEPRWSPNGEKIVYSESQGPDESHIVIMNEDGSNKKNLTSVGGYCIGPKWSPQGDRILYLRGTYFGTIVATAIVDTNGISFDIQFAQENRFFQGDSIFYDHQLMDVQWDATGEYLYLWGSVGKRAGQSGNSDSGEIFLFKINSGKVISRLTHNRVDESWFEISPNRYQILFVHGEYQIDRKIYLMSLTDTVSNPITTGKNDYWPRWANNGKFVVYTKDENDDPYLVNEKIYLINPDVPLKEYKISSLEAFMPDIYIFQP